MPPRLPQVGRNLVNQRKIDTSATNSGVIPNVITCYVCKKSKPQSQYAKRQIQRFANTVSNPYAPAGRCLTDPKTTCRTCTPQQVAEFTCRICNKTKGLTHFSKNQRKNPETARCTRCVKKHVEMEPGASSNSDACSDSESEDHGGDFDGSDDDDKGAGKAPTVMKPKARRGVAGTVVPDDGGAPNSTVDEWNAPLPRPDASFAIDDDDGWQAVSVAGNRAPVRPMHLPDVGKPSTVGYTNATSVRSGQTQAKKNRWAKVDKTPKTQGAASDEWDTYARSLGDRRSATKKQPKKKQVNIDPDEDDERWD